MEGQGRGRAGERAGERAGGRAGEGKGIGMKKEMGGERRERWLEGLQIPKWEFFL